MNRQTRLVWLGTSIAVAVVWAVGLNVDRRAPSKSAQPSAAEPAARTPPVEPSMAAGPAKLAATPQPDPASATPVVQEQKKTPSQLLPPAFESETPDPHWARDAELTIRSAFANAHVPDGALLSVECRRRVCRAEMWFDPREHLAFRRAYEALRGPFGAEVGFDNLANGIRGEPERVAAYFPRKGYVLKDFEGPSP